MGRARRKQVGSRSAEGATRVRIVTSRMSLVRAPTTAARRREQFCGPSLGDVMGRCHGGDGPYTRRLARMLVGMGDLRPRPSSYLAATWQGLVLAWRGLGTGVALTGHRRSIGLDVLPRKNRASRISPEWETENWTDSSARGKSRSDDKRLKDVNHFRKEQPCLND